MKSVALLFGLRNKINSNEIMNLSRPHTRKTDGKITRMFHHAIDIRKLYDDSKSFNGSLMSD